MAYVGHIAETYKNVALDEMPDVRHAKEFTCRVWETWKILDNL